MSQDTLVNISQCSNLKRLTLQNGSVSDGDMEKITANCKKLTYLRLVNCNQITNNSLNTISLNCQSLRNLIIKDYTPITSQGIREFIGNCPPACQLEVDELDFMDQPLLTTKEIDFLVNRVTIVKKNVKLKELQIEHDVLSDKLVEFILKCSSLTHLKLLCKNIDKDLLLSICLACPVMESLDLRNWVNRDFAVFLYLPNRRITHLILNVPDHQVAKIASEYLSLLPCFLMVAKFEYFFPTQSPASSLSTPQPQAAESGKHLRDSQEDENETPLKKRAVGTTLGKRSLEEEESENEETKKRKTDDDVK